MDKWIKYRKGHANIAYTPDSIIASVLRLIGELFLVLDLFLLLELCWWESKCGTVTNVDWNVTVAPDFTAVRGGTLAPS